MLNTYSINNRHTINMPPACVGTLQKTFSKSWFDRFHRNSKYAEMLFDDKPNSQLDLVILQIMVFGDGVFLAEVANKTDYEAYLGELNNDQQ